VKAFLDIHPYSRGHTLVAPKEHFEDIYEIPDEVLSNVVVTSKQIASRLRKVLDVKAVNILHASGRDAQQSVFHFHLHVVPRKSGDGLNLWFSSNREADNNLDRILEQLTRENAH